MDPHGEMRARDISRVARGEQAPRPPHEYGTVSKAPPPASVKLPSNNNRNNMPRVISSSPISYNFHQLCTCSNLFTSFLEFFGTVKINNYFEGRDFKK